MPTFKTDVKRSINASIHFNAFLNRQALKIPQIDIEDLKEVYISMKSQASVQPLSASKILTGIENLRVYVNGEDLTQLVINNLIRKIRQLPRDRFVREYKTSANIWLDHVNSIGINWPEIDQDRIHADSLDADDLIGMMKKLGDRDSGWSGQIHPFNFLYEGIEIEPLSLRDILSQRSGNPDALEEEVIQKGRLDLAFVQEDPMIAGGKLILNIECIYTNPLAELLEHAITELELARRTIEDQRVNYIQPMRDEIDILKENLPLSLASLEDSIKRIEGNIREVISSGDLK